MNLSTVVDPQSYIQFVYDNADYNIATLGGHYTSHSMGGIKQRRTNIRSLSTVTKSIKIKDTLITISPNQLFH